MRRTCYAAVVFTIFFTAGCAHYGALEDDYGNSYTAAKNGQILNAGASKNLEPVTGLSGKAAEAAMESYVDSFNKKNCNKSAQQSDVPMPMGAKTVMDTYGKQDK